MAVLLCQNLQWLLTTRCNVGTIRVLASSVLLDPRFKTLAFGNRTHAQEAVAKLMAESATAIRVERAEPSTSQSAVVSEPGPEAGDNLLYGNCWTAELVQLNDCKTVNVTVEIQRYLSEPYLSRGENPFSYQKTIYPNLFHMAKRYLHMPATTVLCERAALLQSWRGSESKEEPIKATNH